jgi:hypothetical protein
MSALASDWHIAAMSVSNAIILKATAIYETTQQRKQAV